MSRKFFLLLVLVIIVILVLMLGSRIGPHRADCVTHPFTVGEAMICFDVDMRVLVFSHESVVTIPLAGNMTGSKWLDESLFVAFGFPGCKTAWVRRGEVFAIMDVSTVDVILQVQGPFAQLGAIDTTGQLIWYWYNGSTGSSAISGFTGHSMNRPTPGPCG